MLKSIVRRVLGDVRVEQLRRMYSWHTEGIPISSFLHPVPYEFFSDTQVTVYAGPKRDTFFGYYDRSPLNSDASKLLCGCTDFRYFASTKRQPLSIGYFHRGEPRSFIPIAETQAWSTQQSCMATWLPDGNHVIYNDLEAGEPCAKIFSIAQNSIVARFAGGVYAISPDGKSAASCDFARLNRLRPGYGYPGAVDRQNKDAPDNDGVTAIDLEWGRSRLLYSLLELSKINPIETMDGAEHYINHIQFSPSGHRILFIHLWVKSGKQYSRMFTSDLRGENLFLLSNRYVSHYCWRNDEEIVVYSEAPDGEKAYCLYRDQFGFQEKLFVEYSLPDGHGSYAYGAGGKFLTDTYPDRTGYQSLLTIDPEVGLQKLARIYHPAAMSFDQRCDLHPRWSPNNDAIIIDCAPRGVRQIWEISLP